MQKDDVELTQASSFLIPTGNNDSLLCVGLKKSKASSIITTYITSRNIGMLDDYLMILAIEQVRNHEVEN